MREHKGKSLIALPSEYVVIDTETTGLDYECCSIIEISAIRYANGTLVDSFSTLVKPAPFFRIDPASGEWQPYYVDQFIADLTGITNEMLQTAPEPEAVLPLFQTFIGDSILIGHNVNFDINFLYDAMEIYCRCFLTNDFVDMLRLSRKVFPDLAHHRLSDIAEACGVPQPEAHRAKADCLVTAGCYESIRERILSTYHSQEEFAKLFNRKHKKNGNYAASLAAVTANVDQIDDTNPIFGKEVVFTGALSSLTRKEAFQIVANLGANPVNSVTRKTNYLVIGNADFAKSVKEGKTSKMKKAESLIAKGEEIFVISENAFFDMISEYIE